MPERTVKGAAFTIVVGDKRIHVEHVFGKGKRCRISAPPGVVIEVPPNLAQTEKNNSHPAILERLRQSFMDQQGSESRSSAK